MKFLGIDHPAVAADDVEKLSDWYCDVFGYEKWFLNPKPVWMLKAPDGTLLEIMPKDDTLRQNRTTWTPGWSHLALRVENIEQAIIFLEKKASFGEEKLSMPLVVVRSEIYLTPKEICCKYFNVLLK